MFRIPKDFVSMLKSDYIIKDVTKEDYNDVEIYFGNRITTKMIAKMHNLKWIHFGSVGVDKVMNMNKNIIVTNSSGTMDTAIAASGLSLMFALARGIHHCYNLRDISLTRHAMDYHLHSMQDIYAQTVLIVGYGRVGKLIARPLKAMGMNVITYTSKDNLSDLSHDVVEADYVINLLPYTKSTKGIFNKKVFASMKKSSYFINIGRGETTKEEDLIYSLENKLIAGAGLDVFEKEQKLPASPLNETSKLMTMDNVIVTPHIAGWSNNYWIKQEQLFSENLRRYEDGKELLNLVNLEKGY